MANYKKIVGWTAGLSLFVVPISAIIVKKSQDFDLIIGAKSFSESDILANVSKNIIEHYTNNIDIKIKSNLQPSQISFLLDRQVIDGIAEYTGSLLSSYWINPQNNYKAQEIRRWKVDKWSEELPKAKITSNLEYMIGQHLNNQNSLPGIGFNNGYEIIVRKNDNNFFDQNGKQKITTIKEWINVMKNKTFSTDLTFPDAEIGLNFIYDLAISNEVGKTSGLKGKEKFKSLGVALQIIDSSTNRYERLKNGQVDSILGYSTDPQLANPNIEILKLSDKDQVMPTYNAGYLFNKKTLKNYSHIKNVITGKYTSLKSILNKIYISTKEMQEMNKQVQIEHLSAKNVAKNFLKNKSYFE